VWFCGFCRLAVQGCFGNLRWEGERILPVILALCCKATFWFAQGKSMGKKRANFLIGLKKNISNRSSANAVVSEKTGKKTLAVCSE
jgi:hypothetical protein